LEKLYRNPVRREELGTGSDRKKVVPESGTQRGTGNRQRSEESCTGIRYAERNWEWAAIRSKLCRNSVRQVGSGNRQRSEESCTGIRYVREEPGTGSDQKKVVPESGTSGRSREQAAIRRKLYRNPVRQVGTGNRQRSKESCTGIRHAERIWEQAAIGRKLYRNPVRREEPGTGSDRKKLYRNPVRREEPGTGSDRKKLYRNPARQVGSGNGQRAEESCTGIRYAERNREQAAIEKSCTGIRYVR